MTASKIGKRQFQQHIRVHKSISFYFVSIKKNFVTFDGLMANLYSFKTDININKQELNCDNLTCVQINNVKALGDP